MTPRPPLAHRRSTGACLAAALWVLALGCGSDATSVTPAPAPEPTTVAIAPAEPRAGDTLTCTAAGELAASVALAFYVADGWVTGATLATPLRRGDPVSCVARLGDAVVAMDTVHVVNSAPSLAEVEILPAEAGVDAHLTCGWAGFSDADGDADASTAEWFVGGVRVATGSELRGAFARGDEVRCSVTPRDDLAAGAPVSATVVIANTAPTVARVTIASEGGDAGGEILRCAYEGFLDPDGDADHSTIAWTLNGLDAGAGSVLAGPTATGDVAVCSVTPSDGEAHGEPVTARTVLGNHPPTIATAVISPAIAYRGDELTCTWVGFVDVDGDPDLSTAEWTVDGAIVGDGPHLVAPRVDSVVMCRVTPFDGESDGAWVEATATVANRPPSIERAFLIPAAPSAGDLLGCGFEGFVDLDGDPNASRVDWFVNGTPVWSGPVLGAGYATGDEVACRVTPFDGRDAGEPVTATVVIGATQATPLAVPDGPYPVLEDAALDLDAAVDLLANDGVAGAPPPHLVAVAPFSLAGGAVTDLGDGRYRYQPPPDFNGADAVQYEVADAVGATATTQVRLAVRQVNDAPSFTPGGDVVVAEDSGNFDAAWASAISAGPDDEAGQALHFDVVGVSAPALFAQAPTVDRGDGHLRFRPAPDAFGGAIIGVQLVDDGGGADGGVDHSLPHLLRVEIRPVNDAPSFTAGGNVVATEDSGAFDAPWASAISAGPDNEGAQPLHFDVKGVSLPSLFAELPMVYASDGHLRFVPAANAHGVANITLQLVDDDNGGAGGPHTSPARTFRIEISPVNDAPSFTPGADVVVAEDSGAFDAAWASAISAGPDDEAAQALHFDVVGVSAPALFAESVKVDAAAGLLHFVPAPDAHGVALVDLQLVDDGGTSDGGGDRSPVHTLRVEITPVNDAPIIDPVQAITVPELSVASFTASASDPDGDELTFGLLGAPPGAVIDPTTGTFTWTPSAAAGPATYTFHVIATDTGTPPAQASVELKILVTDVNTRPVLVFMSPLTLTAGTSATLGENHLVAADADSEVGYVITAAPTRGRLTIDEATLSVGSGFSQVDLAAGMVKYVDAGTEAGADTFTFVLKDASGAITGSFVAWIVLTAPPPSHLVVSGLATGGIDGTSYIELYNPTASPINLAAEGHTLTVSDANGSLEKTVNLLGVVPPGRFFLVSKDPLARGVAVDLRHGDAKLDVGYGVLVAAADGSRDAVGTSVAGWSGGDAGAAFFEGRALAPLAAGYDHAYLRRGGYGYGACADDGDNVADFVHVWESPPPAPRNSESPAELCGEHPVASLPGPAPQHVVIKEVRLDGPAGDADEYIELFNPTASPVSLAGYTLKVNSSASAPLYTFPAGVTLAPGQHYLLGCNKSATERYGGTVDASYATPIDGAEGVALFNGSAQVDAVATGPSRPFTEGQELPAITGQVDQSYERRDGGCRDDDDNAADFEHRLGSGTPTLSSAAPTPCGLIAYRYFLRPGGASGDEPSTTAALGLSTKGALNATLYNYDVDRDAAPGLLLLPSEALPVPAVRDPTTFQRWVVTFPEGRALHGASATLWGRLASGAGTGALSAHLLWCRVGAEACAPLATAEATAPGGAFAEYPLDFGPLDDVIPAGDSLVLRVAVPEGLAAGPMVVAYGTTGLPAALNLDPGADLAVASVEDVAPAHVAGLFPAHRAYRVTVYAWGPEGSGDVAIIAELPPGVSYVDAIGATCSDAGTSVISCLLPSPALGPPWPTAASALFHVSAAGPGTYTTSFRVLATGAPPDSDPDNDQASITTVLP